MGAASLSTGKKGIVRCPHRHTHIDEAQLRVHCVLEDELHGVPVPHNASLNSAAHAQQAKLLLLQRARLRQDRRLWVQVLREEGLVEHARELGEHLLAGLSALDAPVIRAVRGLGLMVGVELRVRARAVLQQLQDQGVIALPAGSNVVRFLPPLTVTRAEIDQLIDRLERALRASSSPITADA